MRACLHFRIYRIEPLIDHQYWHQLGINLLPWVSTYSHIRDLWMKIHLYWIRDTLIQYNEYILRQKNSRIQLNSLLVSSFFRKWYITSQLHTNSAVRPIADTVPSSRCSASVERAPLFSSGIIWSSALCILGAVSQQLRRSALQRFGSGAILSW